MTMTSAPVTTRAQNGAVPEDNPAARPKRRQFSADYKLAILEEYERITEDGGKGALLRREGLYSSHIVEWQRARDVGALSGLAPKHRKKRSAAERELDAAAPAQRQARRPAGPAPRRPRGPGKSIGALGAAAGAEHSGDGPAVRRRADAVIDECFALVEPLLGTKSRLCRRRAGPGQPLPTGPDRAG